MTKSSSLARLVARLRRRWLPVCAATLCGITVAAAAPITDPIPDPIPLGNVRIRLTTVATGLTSPLWGVAAPGLPGRLFVCDQTGKLWNVDLATGARTVFLDLSARLVPLGVGGPGSYDERGFLGFAFHPDYATNGLVYTYTTEPVTAAPDFTTMPVGMAPDHQNRVLEWRVNDPANPDAVVDPSSVRELLRVDQPQFNHDGGALNFGPDGMLYVALGDGGGEEDVDGQLFFGEPMVGHGTTGNGQDGGTVLGAILRIDVNGSNSVNGQYGIPANNPFVDTPGFVPEIYAYGFRNPYRFSFDRGNGVLIAADVGGEALEEVDLVRRGRNYGWNLKEGTFFFIPNGNDPGYITDVDPGVPPGLVDPIAQYDHDEGSAVIGGFVYRGTRVSRLAGRYVFGDYQRHGTNTGRLFYLNRQGQIMELRIAGQSQLGLLLLGMGEDAAGELYVLANATGTPSGNTGVVLRIDPK